MAYVCSVEKLGIKKGIAQVMPYITSIEKMGIEKGKELGRHEGKLESMLEVVKRLIEAQTGPEFIATITGLPLTQIKTMMTEAVETI